MELPSTCSSRTSDGFDLLLSKLQARNVDFTLHWGQCLPVGYSAASIRRTYGADAATWVAARKTFLPSLTIRRMFSSQVLDRAELSD